MLKIGELSRLVQMSVKTLRYYGERGSLEPAWVDRYTGYRYYDLEQLPRLNRILALKDLGFTLDEIGHILNYALSAEELSGMLRLRQTELQRHIVGEQERLARVEARLRQIAHEDSLAGYAVVLKAVTACHVAGIDACIQGYHEVRGLLARLHAALQAVDLLPAVDGPAMVLYNPEATESAGLLVEAVVPMGSRRVRRLPDIPSLMAHTLEAVPTMACAVHHGPHDALADAYGALLRWIPASGYRTAGPGREVYLREPQSATVSDDCIIEVQLPVESVLASFSTQQKEQLMNPTIETRPAFTAVGLVYHGKNENKEIPLVWDRLNTRWAELEALGAIRGCYGICRDMEPDGSFDYMAGLDVGSGAEPPEGMAMWQVPAATYALFACTLPTIGEAYSYALNTWLPGSGYCRAPSPDLELYPDTFDPADPESELFVCIPVTR